MPFDILLVDDHKIMRDGIKAILKLHPDFNVIAETENGHDAIHFLKRQSVDVVLMDIGLPGLSGIETTSEIMRQSSDPRIIILSMYEDEDSVVAAMRAGARGFVLKQASEMDLVDALRTVARGGTYLSPQVSDKLLKRLQNGNMDTRATTPAVEGLSPRELQVMRMVAEGKTSKEIAVMLDLGLQTVRSYRKTMMKKLGVTNVAGLTQVALAAGVTHLAGHHQPQPQIPNQHQQQQASSAAVLRVKTQYA
jgi:DNA-binding NarL/FixJ family response regulator